MAKHLHSSLKHFKTREKYRKYVSYLKIHKIPTKSKEDVIIHGKIHHVEHN